MIVRKTIFVWGDSAPIWGRYGGLNFGFFGFLAYFGLLLLETLSTDFRFLDGVRHLHGPPNNRGNFTKINFVEFEQCGSKIGVGALLVHFWGLPPSGVRTPHLTHASYSSVDPEKMVFVWGESDPHLGEVRGFEIWLFGAFGLLLLGTVSSDFRLVDCVRQLLSSSNDHENFLKF